MLSEVAVVTPMALRPKRQLVHLLTAVCHEFCAIRPTLRWRLLCRDGRLEEAGDARPWGSQRIISPNCSEVRVRLHLRCHVHTADTTCEVIGMVRLWSVIGSS